MSNSQKTRMLVAQLQSDKKRQLAVLSRASQAHTNFDHSHERSIAAHTLNATKQRQESILSRSKHLDPNI